MTVASNVNKSGPYEGDGANTSFTYGFKIFDKSELRVVHTDADGVETDLVVDVDYTVNNVGSAPPGNTIDYPVSGSPLPSGEYLTIVRDMLFTQAVDLENQGGYYPEVVEKMVDRNVMRLQQLKEAVDRAVKVDVSSDTDPDDLIDNLEASEAAAVASAAAAAASAAAAANTYGYLNEVSLDEYGVAKDGVTDDTAAITSAMVARAAANATLVVPPGSYLYNGTVYTVDDTFRWMDSAFSVGVNPISSAQNSNILLTGSTPDDVTQDVTKSRVLLSSTVEARGGQHGSAARFNLINRSTDGNGCTAVYARSTNVDGSSNWGSAVHGETRHGGGASMCHTAEAASYATTGALYGYIAHNTTQGAEATHPITGAAKAKCDLAVAYYVHGSEEAAPNEDRSKWKYGVHFSADSIRSDGANIYNQSGSDKFIQDDGAHTWGFLLNGSYTSGAIRIPADTPMAWEATGVVKTQYDSTDSAWNVLNGSTKVFKARMNGTGVDIGSGSAANHTHAYIKGSAGFNRLVTAQTGDLSRWAFGVNSDAESTGNAGSNFGIYRYDDAGAYIDAPMTISRSTGLITVKQFDCKDNLSKFGDASSSANQELQIDRKAGYQGLIRFATDNSRRWSVGVGGGTESGGDVNSDFTITHYDDSGSSKGLAMSINRATGNAWFKANATFDGSAHAKGNFTIGEATAGTKSANINGNAGYNRGFAFQTDGVNRWFVGANAAAEGGSDAGSDLFIGAYSDVGGWLGTHMSVSRATGTLTVNRLLSAAGGQIQFPATQNASSNANTLDDYEEGTWTPALDDGSGNNATLSNAVGTYTKIGDTVTIEGSLTASSLGSMSGSNIRISGLPFASASSTGNLHGVNVHRATSLSLGVAGEMISGFVINNNAAIRLLVNGATAGSVALDVSDLTASSTIDFTATYRV